MKRTALAIFHIAICYNVSGQIDTSFAKTDLSKMETQKDIYMQKSRSQKTMGFVMLGMGTTMMFTGSMMLHRVKESPPFPQPPPPHKAYGGGNLIFLGILLDFGSIPFFNASARNKKKAMSMAVINEYIPREMIAYVKQYSIPALSVKWQF